MICLVYWHNQRALYVHLLAQSEFIEMHNGQMGTSKKSAYLDKLELGDELHRSTGLSCHGVGKAEDGSPDYTLRDLRD